MKPAEWFVGETGRRVLLGWWIVYGVGFGALYVSSYLSTASVFDGLMVPLVGTIAIYNIAMLIRQKR